MNAGSRASMKPSQSPTWEEIESLLARELKSGYGGSRSGKRSLARILRDLQGKNRKCATRRGRA